MTLSLRLRQAVFVSACVLLISAAHAHVIIQNTQEAEKVQQPQPQQQQLEQQQQGVEVGASEQDLAATVAISKDSALAPYPDPDLFIALPHPPQENNSSSNATHQVITGQLGLFIFENQDGSDTREFCILVPDDGSDVLVVELENMYADCRDGLSGVFNVTAHDNVPADKSLCDPADLGSCVARGMMEEVEIIGMPAVLDEEDPYSEGFDISQFFDFDNTDNFENENSSNEDSSDSNSNEDSTESSDSESSFKLDTSLQDMDNEQMLCPYIKQLCLRCATDMVSVYSSPLCGDFAAVCAACKANERE